MKRLAAGLLVWALSSACERQVPKGSEAGTLAEFAPKDIVRPSMAGMRYYAQVETRMRPAEDSVKDFKARVAAGLKLSPAKEQALLALLAAIAKARPLIAPLPGAGALHWEQLKEVAEPAVADVERLLKLLNETP